MDKSKWTDRLPDLMEGYTEAEPEGLWDAVQAGMKPKARRVAAGWWYAAGSLAAAAAVVLAVFLWERPRTSPVSPVPGDLLTENTEVNTPTSEGSSVDEGPAGPVEQNTAVLPTTKPVSTPYAGQKRPLMHTEAIAAADEQNEAETHTESIEAASDVLNEPETHTTEPADEPVQEQNGTIMPLEETVPEEWLMPDAVPSTRKKGRGVQLSVTSGGLMAQAGVTSRNGYGMPSAPTGAYTGAPKALFASVHRNKASSTEARHWQNYRVGMLANYAFSPRWSVETGVQFTSLRAQLTTQSGTSSEVAERHFNYLGFPLNIQFKPLEIGQFSLYISAGPAYEFLLGSRERSQSFAGGQLVCEEEPQALALRDSRWSLNGGVGIQWQPFSFGAFFIQPGVSWHLPGPAYAPETFYSSRPVAFDLVFGARVILR